ncbi:hypothetical protein ES703_123226 [subsurface metagenome]
MKDFNLKYLRLAAFAIAVCGYSIITLKPRYIKAVVDGFRLYWNHKAGDELSAIETLKGQTRRK